MELVGQGDPQGGFACRLQAVTVVEAGIEQLSVKLATRLIDYTQSEEFEKLLGRWLEGLRRDLEGRPVGELLTPARREALSEQLDKWVAAIAESNGLERQT